MSNNLKKAKNLPIFDDAKSLAQYLKDNDPKHIICAFLRKDGAISIITVNYNTGFTATVLNELVKMMDDLDPDFSTGGEE